MFVLYLAITKEKGTTFKSVILAGVHDIKSRSAPVANDVVRCSKNLKIKFRDHREVKYNSPWNIAVNFDIDMSFNKNEKHCTIITTNSNFSKWSEIFGSPAIANAILDRLLHHSPII